MSKYINLVAFKNKLIGLRKHSMNGYLRKTSNGNKELKRINTEWGKITPNFFMHAHPKEEVVIK